jgi:hypothetical protein
MFEQVYMVFVFVFVLFHLLQFLPSSPILSQTTELHPNLWQYSITLGVHITFSLPIHPRLTFGLVSFLGFVSSAARSADVSDIFIIFPLCIPHVVELLDPIPLFSTFFLYYFYLFFFVVCVQHK